jgi:ParB family chromosome partitioning protein
MAKRKRLNPVAATKTGVTQAEGDSPPGPLETKAINGWVGVRSRPPIADISGDASMQAALAEVSDELRSARTEGRMVLTLPLDAIDETHLVRDRVALEAEEMDVLRDSLIARGQQTPIDVTDLGNGRYGLISGWRRLSALRGLLSDTGDARFSKVKALVRSLEGRSDAYISMVEENEIRAALSFYERARIAVKAAEQGIYPSTHIAVQSLFSAARAPKRSKIMAFTTLVETLDDDLRFPQALPEKIGLALVSALQGGPQVRQKLLALLAVVPPADALAERALLDDFLRHRPKLKAKLDSDKARVDKKSTGLKGAGGVSPLRQNPVRSSYRGRASMMLWPAT